MVLIRCKYTIFLDKEQIGGKRRKVIPHFSDYFKRGDSGPSSVGDTGGVEVFDSFASFGSDPVLGLMNFQPRNQGELNSIFL